MDKGTLFSGLGHAGLIAWVFIGGFFIRHDTVQEVAMTEVSLVSSAEFEAMQAAVPMPEVARPEPAPQTSPDVDEVAPEAAPDLPDEQTPGPIDLEEPPVQAPDISDRPRPKPAERVAPVPTEAPAPDAVPDPVATPATTPEPAPEAQVVEEELPETAPQEAGTELATEANKAEPLAPSSSSRPRPKPARRAETTPAEEPVETPAETPARAPETTQATRDAIAEALAAATAATSTPEATRSSGPPMSAGEKDALRVAVQACWNVGSLSSEALMVTVTVAVALGQDGKPDAGSVTMTEYEGGSQAAARQAFEAARRAVIRCGANGFNLPAEKYEEWRNLELVFNPERMRIK
ncbi:hypothetical protein [Pseudorhodobacter aquimaris]|uniref:hypothetical protein n=1 Tax=Pseudorhodobacter aquimaris TaxID=687412 RepID=UPI00067B0D03|nr:hypothetical protein [Pseudorhodobacter aquimaris]